MSADPLLMYLMVARDGFDWRLRTVRDEDWSRPTPCAEWNVRDVVNHVVGQNFRHIGLLRGGGLEEYWDVPEDDWLGDNPLTSWERGNHDYDAASAEPGALERLVNYHQGPTTGRLLLRSRVFDMTVHPWDLAQGIGVDDRLDEELVSVMLTGLSAAFSASGTPHFAAPLRDLFPDASPQERLLFFCGRTGSSLPEHPRTAEGS